MRLTRSHAGFGLISISGWRKGSPGNSPARKLSAEDHVLSVDNDVILWRLPAAVRDWLEDDGSLLIAEDVRACHGKFARFCPEAPRNSGMIGFPPGFHTEGKLRFSLSKREPCSVRKPTSKVCKWPS